MSELHIGAGLKLPLETVTQTTAILAVRGAGKSYTAGVLAGEMLRCRQQVVVLDPTGAWYGLRSNAEGTGPGFKIVVLGGDHGDLPLEETAGEVIASSLVEHRFSAVLDMQHFRKAAQVRFMEAFAETLYRLNRQAMHLVVDEADAFAPQRPMANEARMLGAMEDIVRRGRKKGIGCTLISQRPAALNKNVLTQAEMLIAMRLVHPRDIDAIQEWVSVNASEDEAAEVIASLPSLPVGTAWFWSPGWLHLLRKVAIRKLTTFDSFATPKPGEVVKQPASRAEVDLKSLGDKIQATVQKARENDPRELKRQLAELKAQLAKKASPQVETKKIEVPVLSEAIVKRLEAAAIKLKPEVLEGAAAIIREAIQCVRDFTKGKPWQPQPWQAQPPAPVAAPPRKHVPTGAATSEPDLSKPERRILEGLGFLQRINISPATKLQLAMVSGYKIKGGYFRNLLGALRTQGLIEYRGDGVALTAIGAEFATSTEADPTSNAEVHAMVLGTLSTPQSKILTELLKSPGRPLPRMELAARAGFEAGGGYFRNLLGSLRSAGYIRYDGHGDIVVAEVLFPFGV